MDIVRQVQSERRRLQIAETKRDILYDTITHSLVIAEDRIIDDVRKMIRKEFSGLRRTIQLLIDKVMSDS